MYINYKASIFCQQLHSSSYLQWLIKSPYLIPRDLAGLRRYLISISFACSCARFFTSHWKTHLAYRSSLDPLLSPKKYERKHHRLIRSFWVLNFLYLSLPDPMQTFIYIYINELPKCMYAHNFWTTAPNRIFYFVFFIVRTCFV